MKYVLCKYTLTFVSLLMLFSTFGQNNYQSSWQIIDELEKKGLFREALKTVSEVLDKAVQDDNTSQVIKANFYQLKYNQYLTEDDYVLGVNSIESLIGRSNPQTRAILHSVLAEVYYGYYSRNSWKFADRTTVAGDVKMDDIRTWDIERLAKKVIYHYQSSVSAKSVLTKHQVSEYSEIIQNVNSGEKDWSLYQFLTNRAFTFFSTNSFNIDGPAETFTIGETAYFGSNSSFTNLSLSTNDSFNLKFYAAELLQSLTKVLQNENKIENLFHVQVERLKFAKNYSTLTDAELRYEQGLKDLTIAYKDHDFSGEAWYELAQLYFNQSGAVVLKTASEDEKQLRYRSAFICKQVIERAPDSFGAKQCKALLSQINRKDLKITAEQAYLPNKKDKFLVSYQNCEKVFVKIIEFPSEQSLNGEDLKEKIQKTEAVYEEEVTLSGINDFYEHSTELLMPELEAGHYLLAVSSTKEIKNREIGLVYAKFWVTQLTYQTKVNGNNLEVMALCRKTGHPLEKAEVKLIKQQYQKALRKYVKKTVSTKKTNKEGIATVDGLTDYQSYFVSIKSGDDHYSPSSSLYFRKVREANYAAVQINLFTDRKLYRPGQTIYFKGIATYFDGKSNVLKPNYETVVRLYDANYQEVKSMVLKTNEFGSFEGKFLAPYGVLTGTMTIQTGNGSQSVQVEEYKRPKFSAQILPLDGEFQINDVVTIKGMAEAFAGSKISDAIVKYRVQRTARFRHWYWWYRPSPAKEVSNGETVTNEKGEFEISFKAIPDMAIDPKTRPTFNYTVTVDVIDINGETHSATKSVSIGYHSVLLSNSLAGAVNASKTTAFSITSTDLNGSKIETTGQYEIYKLTAPKSTKRKRLWSAPDQQQWDKKVFTELFPTDVYSDEADFENWDLGDQLQSGTFNTGNEVEIELEGIGKWQTGRYKYVATTTDKNGIEVKDETFFTVFNPSSKKSVDNMILNVMPLASTVKPNEQAKFLISTAEAHLNIYYSVDFKGETIHHEWLHLKDEQVTVKFDVKPEHIGKLSFDFTAVKNDRSYQSPITITVPAPDHHLDISLESFRDKLLPGQDEAWSVVIKNAKGEKAQAELLATLYDASLDELFTKNSFNLSLRSPYYESRAWSTPEGFRQVAGSNINYYWNSYSSPPTRYFPSLNQFGYNAYHRLHYGLESVMSKSNRGSKILMEEDMEGSALEDAAPMLADASNAPKKEFNKESELSANQAQSTEPVENSSPASPQPRTNFNETAFFYPQLHTNEKGEIRIKFTIPESLTKWRFLGLAHSKTLEVGTIEKELVTQKDLMVLPNMPRFLRETDEITVSTKIANISSDLLSGTASIKFFDPMTENDITASLITVGNIKPFSVESDGNTQVSWTLTIPDNWSAIKYQIMAESPKHLDGEENVLPVLSNRMLVTESMPMPMSRQGTKSFSFKKLKTQKSNTLKHHQLTLEFTSNPAWYALQAMPYMMEYPYECAEQTFTRYYSNAIATHVLNSKPKIKAIIDQWKMESPQAFLSNLNKNQELKSLLIEETPWVLNANNESETKRNLAVLLDLNRMQGELEKTLAKVIKAQSANGGWAWFPGMKQNRYITQHIATGLGHLDVLGITAIKDDKKVRQMVEKSVKFLDSEIVKDLKRLKRYHSESYLKNQHIGYVQVQYLYMRSYFMDITMNKATEEAVLYYKSQAEKYWLQFNIYARGMIALAAKRLEMHELSTTIYKSLKDNAIISEEFGMYWKSSTSGFYWYQAPVETQTLMIEFFNEMDDMVAVEELKMWLLKEKQTTHWKTTKQTAEAVYALLLNGIDLLETNQLVDISIGGKKIEYVQEPSTNPYKVKSEAGTGYFKTKWNETDITSKMADVVVSKSTPGPAWGAMYWQYFEQLDKITFAKTPLKLDKELYKVVLDSRGEKLVPITDESAINIGDKMRVRIELRTDRNLEYVHMKDMRASGFEPVNVISSFKYQGGLGYYQATKDAATNFFFDFIPKGTYVFEYDLKAEQIGDFSNGVATIQCMYAPEFTSHSNGIRINITAKK